jgi:hypothetical protein
LEEHSWVAKSWLVVSNMNGLFPIVYGMSSQPHWRTPSFFRGVGQPPTSVIQPVLVTTLHYSNIISYSNYTFIYCSLKIGNNYESVITTSIVTTSFNSNLHYIIYHYIIENWKFCHENRLRPLWKMSRKIAVHRTLRFAGLRMD